MQFKTKLSQITTYIVFVVDKSCRSIMIFPADFSQAIAHTYIYMYLSSWPKVQCGKHRRHDNTDMRLSCNEKSIINSFVWPQDTKPIYYYCYTRPPDLFTGKKSCKIYEISLPRIRSQYSLILILVVKRTPDLCLEPKGASLRFHQNNVSQKKFSCENTQYTFTVQQLRKRLTN